MAARSLTLRKKLIAMLADGGVHSGVALAQRLDISRTAVWKHVQQLQGCGLPIETLKGRGYRINQPVELLQARRIRAHLSPETKSRITSLQILFETPSTNDILTGSIGRESIHGRAVLAEYQSRGRGRRGNNWISPLAGGISLTLGWHYDIPPMRPGCLSLAVAVGVMHALQQLGVNGAGLKWPNDIYAGGRKLGGILVEMRGENAGPVDVVTGVGINVTAGATIRCIEQPITDLSEIAATTPSRNRLASSLINELSQVLDQYPIRNTREVLDEWRHYDCARGHRATIRLPGKTCSGEVLGVDEEGALQMRINNTTRTFTSGEVSLSVQP